VAKLALRRRLRTRSRPQCHDVRYRLTPPSPAPEPRFRRYLAVASVPAKAPAASSIRPKSPNRPRRQRQARYRDRGSRPLRPPTHLQPKPPPRQIPIDGNRPPGGSRVPPWEAFGRRPSERTRIVTTDRHPKPFTDAVACLRCLEGRLWGMKSGSPPPRLSGRYWIGSGTFAGPSGDAPDAPKDGVSRRLRSALGC